MKIIINNCFGGFGFSEKANQLFRERDGKSPKYKIYETTLRTNPIMIKVVEELGEEANGKYSKLKIVEIPDDVEWQIEEYDGIEWVAEKHRTWD